MPTFLKATSLQPFMSEDADDVRRALTIVFRGTDGLARPDVERAFSFDMEWVAPHEAEEVVKKIARINGAAPFELRLEQSSKSDNTRNFWKLFSFDDGHLYTTLAVSLLWLVMGFTFYGISLLVVRVSGENDDDCDFNFDFLVLPYWFHLDFLVISL